MCIKYNTDLKKHCKKLNGPTNMTFLFLFLFIPHICFYLCVLLLLIFGSLHLCDWTLELHINHIYCCKQNWLYGIPELR